MARRPPSDPSGWRGRGDNCARWLMPSVQQEFCWRAALAESRRHSCRPGSRKRAYLRMGLKACAAEPRAFLRRPRRSARVSSTWREPAGAQALARSVHVSSRTWTSRSSAIRLGALERRSSSLAAIDPSKPLDRMRFRGLSLEEPAAALTGLSPPWARLSRPGRAHRELSESDLPRRFADPRHAIRLLPLHLPPHTLEPPHRRTPQRREPALLADARRGTRRLPDGASGQRLMTTVGTRLDGLASFGVSLPREGLYPGAVRVCLVRPAGARASTSPRSVSAPPESSGFRRAVYNAIPVRSRSTDQASIVTPIRRSTRRGTEFYLTGELARAARPNSCLMRARSVPNAASRRESMIRAPRQLRGGTGQHRRSAALGSREPDETPPRARGPPSASRERDDHALPWNAVEPLRPAPRSRAERGDANRLWAAVERFWQPQAPLDRAAAALP